MIPSYRINTLQIPFLLFLAMEAVEACSRVMKSRFIMVLSVGMSEDGPKWKKVT